MKWVVRKLKLEAGGSYTQIFFWIVEGRRSKAVKLARTTLDVDEGADIAVSIQPASASVTKKKTDKKLN